MKKVLVTGAGGFIAHHLVSYLVEKGYWVRGVDIKQPEFEESKAHSFELLDLRLIENCQKAVEGVDEVYHLAADMGGIGYITGNCAIIASHNTMINVHMLEAARIAGVERFLFSSTACVYPQHLQETTDAAPLKEEDAYPADPEEGYGWEKLYMEKLCQYYHEDFGLETRIVRFHNVFGPLGTYQGGREKSPAAMCRKVALAEEKDSIDVWGDGEQTRTYMYIDDCVEGIYRLMRSDYSKPLNLGRDELVTINELVDVVARIADKKIDKDHDLSKPQGVRGRNSDNSRIRKVLNWEPEISLGEGLVPTYEWIFEKLFEQPKVQSPEASPVEEQSLEEEDTLPLTN
ncbi:UNVERIFIED_CONTAM: hypothetical protein GTU68_050155 [Idotea baltica]|nr:hypothetical protein [Idotea baltica]